MRGGLSIVLYLEFSSLIAYEKKLSECDEIMDINLLNNLVFTLCIKIRDALK